MKKHKIKLDPNLVCSACGNQAHTHKPGEKFIWDLSKCGEGQTATRLGTPAQAFCSATRVNGVGNNKLRSSTPINSAYASESSEYFSGDYMSM